MLKIFFLFLRNRIAPVIYVYILFVKKTGYIQVKRMKIREKEKNIVEILARRNNSILLDA